MQGAAARRWCPTIPAIALIAAMLPSAGHAEGNFKICHAGVVTLLDFGDHIRKLRAMNRYDADMIDTLVKAQRKGGADFFSSQIAYQEAVNGSGTFDLRSFHGILDAKDYLNVTSWTCGADDFPVAYFIGFRVQEAADNTISLARAKGIVNVLSLKGIGAGPNKRVKVKLADGDKVLCEDIAKACVAEVYYDNGW
ncbi:MAG: hypothetical protein WDN50_13290 [Bradyrhizobium sp.]